MWLEMSLLAGKFACCPYVLCDIKKQNKTKHLSSCPSVAAAPAAPEQMFLMSTSCECKLNGTTLTQEGAVKSSGVSLLCIPNTV